MRYSLDSDNTDEALPMPSVFLQCLELGIPPQSTDEPLVETVAAYRIHIHSESKKNRATMHSFVTLTNVGRFSKFFHCCILQEICNKTHATLPTTP